MPRPCLVASQPKRADLAKTAELGTVFNISVWAGDIAKRLMMSVLTLPV